MRQQLLKKATKENILKLIADPENIEFRTKEGFRLLLEFKRKAEATKDIVDTANKIIKTIPKPLSLNLNEHSNICIYIGKKGVGFRASLHRENEHKLFEKWRKKNIHLIYFMINLIDRKFWEDESHKTVVSKLSDF